MRILIIHNSYQIRGGEDAVVQSEFDLLVNGGHEVELLILDNDSINCLVDKISVSLQVLYSFKSRKRISECVERFKPAIIHVHNFFPLITPSVYDVAIEYHIPIVQTLHNFRILCPNGLFLRDGNVCEKCIGGQFYHSVIYKCYRGSLPGSLAVATFDYFHRSKNTWNSKVNAFIALSEFSRSKFIEGGINSDLIHVKPNFVESVAYDQTSERRYGLYVGRLSEEKGVRVLFESVKDLSFPIKIVGEGPLLSKLPDGVEYLGKKSQEEVAKLMQSALFLVVPSICYENFPRTIVEAFSNRLAVITANHGSMKEIVTNGETGLLFEAGSAADLREKIDTAISNPELLISMGNKCLSTYNEKYSPIINLNQLVGIYKSLIENNAK